MGRSEVSNARGLALAVLGSALCLALGGCGPRPDPGPAAAQVARGKALTVTLGCGSCHAIAGVEGANGMVGPPLSNIGERSFIAGVLPNTPANMVVWLKSPQSVIPNNVMPDTGLSDRDARDIAAYLSTLRRG
jgi:cytochrome c2